MTAHLLYSRRLEALPLYGHFSLLDPLVEPSVEDTRRLYAAAGAEGVASDGHQVLIEAPSGISVQVDVETYSADPQPAGSTKEWSGQLLGTLQCPSGELFIEQSVAPAVMLDGALPAGAGVYAFRVLWRAAATPSPELLPNQVSRYYDYVIQLWRLRDLTRQQLDELGIDDEDDE